MRTTPPLYPDQVYATWPVIGAVSGIDASRIYRWKLRRGLRRVLAIDPEQPDRTFWLFRLSDVLKMAPKRSRSRPVRKEGRNGAAPSTR
jgi:hypothetical protein